MSGFNPHRPVKAGASQNRQADPRGSVVSILTGPLRPVLPARGISKSAAARVSILTGPLRPVLQYHAALYHRQTSSFNPHRPVKAGASGKERTGK